MDGRAGGRAGAGARAVSRLVRAHALAVADQVLSSVSNVLVVVVVARSAAPQGFGAFALAYAVLLTVVSVNRVWLGNRISLCTGDAQARETTARLVGGHLATAPVLAGGVLVGCVVLGAELPVSVAIAVATPVVCMQDLVRFGAVSGGRTTAAVTSDAVWTAVLVVALLVLPPTGPEVAVAVWAAGALAALVAGALVLRIRPAVSDGLRELRRRDALGGSMVYGRLVTAGASLTVVAAVGALIGAEAVGALRAASTLMGPLNGVFALVALVVTPVVVRRPRSDDLRACGAVALGLLVLVVLLGGLLLLVPDAAGRVLLGDSWPAARTVLPWTVLEYAVLSAATALLLAARVRGDAAAVFVQQTVLGVTTVLAGVLAAAVLGEARWVAAGLAVAGLAATVAGASVLASRRVAVGAP